MKTVAPATTANLGPGFDCAAVALDLWNEVEVSEGAEAPPDPTHIGIRAFGLDVVTKLCERLIDGGAPGVHFYTLNQSALTLELCKRLGLGPKA